MKTTFAVIGVVFVILILYAGDRFDGLYKDYQKATSFIEETIDAVVPEWDQEELVRRFAPEALESISDAELDQGFQFYRTVFGELVTRGSADGNLNAEVRGARLGVFTVSMDFAARSAVATVTVQKFRKYWAVTDFRIQTEYQSHPQDEEKGQEPNRTLMSMRKPADAEVGQREAV